MPIPKQIEARESVLPNPRSNEASTPKTSLFLFSRGLQTLSRLYWESAFRGEHAGISAEPICFTAWHSFRLYFKDESRSLMGASSKKRLMPAASVLTGIPIRTIPRVSSLRRCDPGVWTTQVREYMRKTTRVFDAYLRLTQRLRDDEIAKRDAFCFKFLNKKLQSIAVKTH